MAHWSTKGETSGDKTSKRILDRLEMALEDELPEVVFFLGILGVLEYWMEDKFQRNLQKRGWNSEHNPTFSIWYDGYKNKLNKILECGLFYLLHFIDGRMYQFFWLIMVAYILSLGSVQLAIIFLMSSFCNIIKIILYKNGWVYVISFHVHVEGRCTCQCHA